VKALRTMVAVDGDGSGGSSAIVDAVRLGPDIDVLYASGFERLTERVRAAHPAVLVLVPKDEAQALTAVAQVMARHPVPILVIGDGGFSRERLLGAGALELMPRPAGDPALEAALRKTVRLIGGVAVILHVRGRGQVPEPSELTVVGIAASTGGPEAVARILHGLQGLRGSVLVVQHMHPTFMDRFVEWMQRESALPVEVAQNGASLRPGHVHLGPPGVHLRLAPQRKIRLDAEPPILNRPSADILFRSMAERVGPAGIGVLLTGMGEDGAEGLLALRLAGGRTLAQDERSSAVFGMPQAAEHLGAAERMVPLDRIASAIMSAAAVEV
jgi:two-component system chemotaxis response regulator CheB